MSAPVTCRDVDDRLEELALDVVEEPSRSRLLAHAAACPTCGTALDDLAHVADDLLVAAPEVEPPAGFEHRVLGRLTTTPEPAAIRRRRRTGVAAAATAAAVLLAFAVGHLTAGRPAPTARHGVVEAAGHRIGTVELAPGTRPHVLVTLRGEPPAAGGARRCELELPDGTRLVVGSWTYDQLEAGGGVWATAVDPRALDATTMRVLDEQGDVLATAHLA